MVCTHNGMCGVSMVSGEGGECKRVLLGEDWNW